VRNDVSLGLANPLPEALQHYESELRDVLVASGVSVRSAAVPSVEVAGASRAVKLSRAARTVVGRISPARTLSTLVLWPVFGMADPVTWSARRGRVWIVVHDASPLRDQAGMGRAASLAGRLAPRWRVGVIAHTDLAADVLRVAGWRPTVVPHPIRRPSSSTVSPGDRVVVLGQWKPARSLQPLEALAQVAELDGCRQIVGRGWPKVAGWSMDDRFVPEAELTQWIDRSKCVVLPYDRYFQSNISVRALERLRPVVGRRHEFLLILYGEDWPGFVVNEDWAGAVERASAVSGEDLAIRRADYWDRCVAAWREFATKLPS
jgi:hypothetical protein